MISRSALTRKISSNAKSEHLALNGFLQALRLPLPECDSTDVHWTFLILPRGQGGCDPVRGT